MRKSTLPPSRSSYRTSAFSLSIEMRRTTSFATPRKNELATPATCSSKAQWIKPTWASVSPLVDTE